MMTEEQESTYLNSLEEVVTEMQGDTSEPVLVLEGELSLNAITGNISSNTMKFVGEHEKHTHGHWKYKHLH